jgi:hypothetical protein
VALNRRTLKKKANAADDLLSTIHFPSNWLGIWGNFEAKIRRDCFQSESNDVERKAEGEVKWAWFESGAGALKEKQTTRNTIFRESSCIIDPLLFLSDVNHHNNFGLAMKSAQFVTTKTKKLCSEWKFCGGGGGELRKSLRNFPENLLRKYDGSTSMWKLSRVINNDSRDGGMWWIWGNLGSLMELLERIFPIRMDHLDLIAKVSLHLESFQSFQLKFRTAEEPKQFSWKFFHNKLCPPDNSQSFSFDVTTSD